VIVAMVADRYRVEVGDGGTVLRAHEVEVLPPVDDRAKGVVIITCAGLKGGLGKTTTAAYCAHALAEFGHRVVLLDADPQGSVTRWATGAGWASGPAVWVEPWQPRRAGDLRAAGWSVVIDTPPFADGIVEHALTDATHVVVPMARPAPTTTGCPRWPG
jgi:CobQ/CobB/MinD/ParA nucleotide binding domain